MGKAERRARAKARFRVLTMEEYIASSLARTKNRMTIGNGDAGYSAYKARKAVEWMALRDA